MIDRFRGFVLFQLTLKFAKDANHCRDFMVRTMRWSEPKTLKMILIFYDDKIFPVIPLKFHLFNKIPLVYLEAKRKYNTWALGDMEFILSHSI